MLLNHNHSGSGIRRTDGLTDADWDALVAGAERKTLSDPTLPFVHHFVTMALANPDKYAHVLHILVYEQDKDADEQDWNGIALRFFRHFCPENLRNAMSRGGISYAALEFDGKEFMWVSRFDFVVATDMIAPVLSKASVGDHVSLVVSGFVSIHNIDIYVNGVKTTYYAKGDSKFGDLIYKLRKSLIANYDASREVT